MGRYRFAKLPAAAAWRLSGAYEGFEVVRFAATGGGVVLTGTSVGVEQGAPWSLGYVIEVADDWHVRQATVTDDAGNRLDIQTDGAGSWTVNGAQHPELAGCLDLDLEASAVTNTLPVHRLALPVAGSGESAAADGLAVGYPGIGLRVPVTV